MNQGNLIIAIWFQILMAFVNCLFSDACMKKSCLLLGNLFLTLDIKCYS